MLLHAKMTDIYIVIRSSAVPICMSGLVIMIYFLISIMWIELIKILNIIIDRYYVNLTHLYEITMIK